MKVIRSQSAGFCWGVERAIDIAAKFADEGRHPVYTDGPLIHNKQMMEKLTQKGIKKYIAYEVSEELVKQLYGKHFNVILGDLKQTDDLRVLDYDGHHVFYNFSLNELGQPVYHEA